MTTPNGPDRAGPDDKHDHNGNDEDELRQHAESSVEGSATEAQESRRTDDLRAHAEDPAEG